MEGISGKNIIRQTYLQFLNIVTHIVYYNKYWQIISDWKTPLMKTTMTRKSQFLKHEVDFSVVVPKLRY